MAISVEAGFMLAAAYKLWNNLWVPIGIHWAWNFFLGQIFGVGVSGISQDACVIIPKITGPYILTGGDNGFEGPMLLSYWDLPLVLFYFVIKHIRINK